MTKIVREVTVSCPPERVFAVLSNVERLAEFSHMTVEVRNGPGRTLEVGDTFEQTVSVFGVDLDTQWEVTEVQANSLIRVEGRSKGNGRASMTERLTPQGTGCHVQLDVDYDPPLGFVGEIADKLVFEKRHEDDAEQLLASLKTLCETSPEA
jgi:uncharacterized protein YndB with AHSA1/START domain